MTAYRKSRSALFFVLAWALLFFISGTAVLAQGSPGPSSQIESPTPSEDGLHVSITPYLWFAGVHGTTGVFGHDASVHADFGDIFNYLNIGAMGQLEVRYNRVIMPVDFMWMKLSDNQGLPLNDLGVQSIKAKMTETMLAPKIGYRVANGKRVKVDALIGIRYWHLATDSGRRRILSVSRLGRCHCRRKNSGCGDSESVRGDCWRRWRSLCAFRLPGRRIPWLQDHPQMRSTGRVSASERGLQAEHKGPVCIRRRHAGLDDWCDD